MALQDLLELSIDHGGRKKGLSEERIKAQIPIIRQYVAFWREYPDIFVEFLCGDNPENFKLFFYQRIFLRAVMRHRFAYATFPRRIFKIIFSCISFNVALCIISRCTFFRYYRW